MDADPDLIIVVHDPVPPEIKGHVKTEYGIYWLALPDHDPAAIFDSPERARDVMVTLGIPGKVVKRTVIMTDWTEVK